MCSPHRLPFRDGTMDVVFSAFAPTDWEEFLRVLRPGGAVVTVRGGREHLAELRRRSAAAEGTSQPKQFPAGLAENYVRVRTEEAYSGAAAAALVEMAGPGTEAAAPGRVTVDVIISTHRVWLGTGGEPT